MPLNCHFRARSIYYIDAEHSRAGSLAATSSHRPDVLVGCHGPGSQRNGVEIGALLLTGGYERTRLLNCANVLPRPAGIW